MKKSYPVDTSSGIVVDDDEAFEDWRRRLN